LVEPLQCLDPICEAHVKFDLLFERSELLSFSNRDADRSKNYRSQEEQQ